MASRGAGGGGPSRAEVKMMDKAMERLQVEEDLIIPNKAADRCFVKCIDDFTSDRLKAREEVCVSRCLAKHPDHNDVFQRAFAAEYRRVSHNP